MLHIVPCNFAALPECLHLPVPGTLYMHDMRADGFRVAIRLHWLPVLVRHIRLIDDYMPRGAKSLRPSLLDSAQLLLQALSKLCTG